MFVSIKKRASLSLASQQFDTLSILMLGSTLIFWGIIDILVLVKSCGVAEVVSRSSTKIEKQP